MRLHQLLAGIFVFGTMKHLASLKKTRTFWIPIYTFAAICGALTLFQTGLVVYRNKQRSRPYSRIFITHVYGTVEATIILSRPLQFYAGQYIVLWIPSVSFWSSHPFTVVSWSPGRQSQIRLLIEPRKGLTDGLLQRSMLPSSEYISYHVFFSGPHGQRLSAKTYKTIVLFAEASGLRRILPHLREFIHTYDRGSGLTRRIHLVWQIYNSREPALLHHSVFDIS